MLSLTTVVAFSAHDTRITSLLTLCFCCARYEGKKRVTYLSLHTSNKTPYLASDADSEAYERSEPSLGMLLYSYQVTSTSAITATTIIHAQKRNPKGKSRGKIQYPCPRASARVGCIDGTRNIPNIDSFYFPMSRFDAYTPLGGAKGAAFTV